MMADVEDMDVKIPSGYSLEKFGKRLEMTIEKRGMSKVYVARQLCVTQPTVLGWCKGRNFPNMDSLVKLCMLLRVRMDWLVMGVRANDKK